MGLGVNRKPKKGAKNSKPLQESSLKFKGRNKRRPTNDQIAGEISSGSVQTLTHLLAHRCVGIDADSSRRQLSREPASEIHLVTAALQFVVLQSGHHLKESLESGGARTARIYPLRRYDGHLPNLHLTLNSPHRLPASGQKKGGRGQGQQRLRNPTRNLRHCKATLKPYAVQPPGFPESCGPFELLCST